MENNSLKPALLAAGKLALAAEMVVKANALNLSHRVEQLYEFLNAYNSEILKLADVKQSQND